MQDIVIDPYTLIFDTLNNSKIKMQHYIERILDTGDIEEYKFLKGLISGNTTELLITQNNYPEWEILNAELKKFDLSKIYQAQDIIRVLERILRLDTIEEHTKIKEVLFQPSVTDSIEHATDLYLRELERLYVYCYLNNRINGSTLLKSSITKDVNVSNEVLDLDSSEFSIETPFSFNENLKTIRTLEEILLTIDCIELWKKSDSGEHLIQIIKLHLFQEKVTSKVTWTLGTSFINNFKKYGFFQENSKINGLLRSLLEVITESNLSKTHALRESNAGSSPQREGVLGKAWRYDIDREFHLHYWKKESEIIFASIGPHNEFSIPE